MSVLSALGGSGRTGMVPAGTGDGAGKEGSNAQDFASMLDNDPHAASATRPKTAQKLQDKAASQSDGRTQPGPPDRQPGRTRTGPSHGAQADGGSASETGETAAGKSEAKTTGHEDSDDDTWPPAGLAGIGMAVLPALDAATPGAVAASLTGAGLAANPANAAAEGVAGLSGDQGGLPAAAVAHAGSSALLAQAVTSSKSSADGADASAPLVTLAALAGTVESKTDDAGTSAGTDPINLLAMATTAPPSRALGSVPFSGSPTPTPNLHGEQFDDALGARMSWLAEQKIGHAQIRISPAELGPVEVRLHLNGDQVNASFLSAQAEVRHALESSLPRLREMLGQHGFQLGQADVGQQQQQASQGHPSAAGDSDGPNSDELLQGTAGIPAVVLHQRGLLDAYA